MEDVAAGLIYALEMSDLSSVRRTCHGLRMIKASRVAAVFLGLAIFLAPVCMGGPSTPKPGSSERTSICDAMRAYAMKSAIRPLPKPILFKIEFIRVDGDYAGFEGFPIFADGSAAIPNFMPDIVLTTFLKRRGTGWQVIADLSRTDVPSDTEMATIRKRFPTGVPITVIPEFWRRKLRP